MTQYWPKLNNYYNTTYASYQLATNTAGAQELKKYGIPNTFPAVINHSDSDYDFYYLAGDFSDNPIGFTTSYFKGIGLLKSFFYNANEPSDRGGFFFNFYKQNWFMFIYYIILFITFF